MDKTKSKTEKFDGKKALDLLRKINKNYEGCGIAEKTKGYMTLRDEEAPEELMKKKTNTEVTLTVKAKITSIEIYRSGSENKEHKSISFDILDLVQSK